MRPHILAIASGGGHWEQLMIIRQSLPDEGVLYVTTLDGLGARSKLSSIVTISDCNRHSIGSTVTCGIQLLSLILRIRPRLVITTGAAPGLIGLCIGKLFGAKAIWIDSVANSEELSLSGRIAGLFADLWVTQWESLSSPKGPTYIGNLL